MSGVWPPNLPHQLLPAVARASLSKVSKTLHLDLTRLHLRFETRKKQRDIDLSFIQKVFELRCRFGRITGTFWNFLHLLYLPSMCGGLLWHDSLDPETVSWFLSLVTVSQGPAVQVALTFLSHGCHPFWVPHSTQWKMAALLGGDIRWASMSSTSFFPAPNPHQVARRQHCFPLEDDKPHSFNRSTFYSKTSCMECRSLFCVWFYGVD